MRLRSSESGRKLEVGKEATLSFSMTGGQTAECYINKVYMMDMWAEEEKRFADKEYRERMLAHVSEEKLGSHGLKLQGCVIQTPLPPETTTLAAELFAYCERVKRETRVL